MSAESINCCVTSPPYFGLRDYGHAGQIGLEPTPAEFVDALVAVFEEVRRVLREDGTLWLNLGDSYAGSGRGMGDVCSTNKGNGASRGVGSQLPPGFHESARVGKQVGRAWVKPPEGFKNKDLIGIPWAVAKALQAPRYLGRISNELDRVWMAATIDAEGSICGFHHTRKDDGSLRTGIHITITNTNRAMLDNAFRIWPTSRGDHNQHGDGHFGSMVSWRWIAHDVDEKAELLRELYPYFVCKKQQALLAWNFLELSKDAKRLGHSPEKLQVKEKRSWIVHALTKLNHQQPVDIPVWIQEPTECFGPGWYLRSDIIWAKANCMPESVTDRPTKSHEYIFLLSKSESYHYDAEAIKEPTAESTGPRMLRANNGYAPPGQQSHGGCAAPRPNVGRGGKNAFRGQGHFREGDNGPANREGRDMANVGVSEMRNKRSVWNVATSPYPESHFATFPPDLIRPCILAGCPVGGTVLDCFGGSGTTGEVAEQEGRHSVLIELNPEYVELAKRRNQQMGLLHSA